MKNKKEESQTFHEEYGLELGDINAVKYYELAAGNDKKKKKESSKVQEHDKSESQND